MGRTEARTRIWRAAGVASALLVWGSIASGEYVFQALGTFSEASSAAAAINDSGQIAGTLSGT